MKVTEAHNGHYTITDLTPFELVALQAALRYGATAYQQAVQLTNEDPTWLTSQAETMLALSHGLHDTARRASRRPDTRGTT
jgi:hypothetical protein